MSSRMLIRISADAAQRLACIAIFALLAAPLIIAFGHSERPILAIAFGSAILAGAIGLTFWIMPALPAPRRRQGRGLAIMAAVLLLATSTLMADRSLRETLRRVTLTIYDNVVHPSN